MATDYGGGERRKEMRYPLEARVIVRRKSGDTVHATAVDISSSGMRLRFGAPCPLARDEEILVEVELSEYSDKPFSSWGVGRIAYIDGNGAGVQLHGGQFDASTLPEAEPGEPS